jgi:hypothetical protein
LVIVANRLKTKKPATKVTGLKVLKAGAKPLYLNVSK